MGAQGEKPSRPPAVGKKNKEKKKEEEGQENEKVQGKKGKDAEKQPTNPPPPPPPPTEVVMKVGMHCEGCARTVLRSLKGFEGVENVTADCRTQKVVVKGKKAAEDPLKVVERVKKKSGRRVELVSPLPAPPEKPELEKKEEDNKIAGEKLKEAIVVVLKIQMHCEACAEEIRRTILRFKGVETAAPDFKNSTVTAIGVLEPSSLASYVQKKTGKQAEVVKQEPKQKKRAPAPEKPNTTAEDQSSTTGKKTSSAKGEKTTVEGEVQAGEGKEKEKNKKMKNKKKKAETDHGAGGGKKGATEEESTIVEGKMKMIEHECCNYMYNPSYPVAYYEHPPLIFSDENPNACVVM